MRRRYDDGQSLVEVALVLPILLIILLGIFDFGRAVFAYNAVSNSAREAVRVAIVNQSPATVEAEGKQAAIGLDPDAVAVTSAHDCDRIGCTASVTVSHQWQAITPIIGSLIGPIELESTTDMPIERVFVSP
ncbi:MAG: TadE/TadG family type IV pilus assembly protein [Candidatus Limnocylindrales bacterium]